MVSKPKLVQQVFEARYERGYRYLDRCGEAMLILEGMLPAETGKVWMPDEIVPSGAKLKCPDLDVYVAFDTYHLVVEQNPTDVDPDFPTISDLIYSTISARFDIRDILRVGHRRMQMLGADSVEDAERLSVKLAPFKDWPMAPPGGLAPTAAEATSVFEGDNGRGYRFSIRPSSRVEAPLQLDPRLRAPPRLRHEQQNRALVEQLKRQAQREKEPLAGVLIDIDYYEVRPTKVDVRKFMAEGVELGKTLLSAFARGS